MLLQRQAVSTYLLKGGPSRGSLVVRRADNNPNPRVSSGRSFKEGEGIQKPSPPTQGQEASPQVPGQPLYADAAQVRA